MTRKMKSAGDDYGIGDIIEYSFFGEGKFQQTVIRSGLAHAQSVYCSQVKPYYAFADLADVYIGSLGSGDELVFKGGGTYTIMLGCSRQRASDMHWSPDGNSLIFRYYEDFFEETEYQLWEVWFKGHQNG